MSSISLSVNRNKRSLANDRKSPSGVAAVRAVYPRIVRCAATGCGQRGPAEALPAPTLGQHTDEVLPPRS